MCIQQWTVPTAAPKAKPFEKPRKLPKAKGRRIQRLQNDFEVLISFLLRGDSRKERNNSLKKGFSIRYEFEMYQ